MADDLPPAGELKPATLVSIDSEIPTVTSINPEISTIRIPNLEDVAAATALKTASTSAQDLDYPVADLFGRCFLRLCLWVDQFAEWTKNHAPRRLVGGLLPADSVPNRVLKQLDAVVGSATVDDAEIHSD